VQDHQTYYYIILRHYLPPYRRLTIPNYKETKHRRDACATNFQPTGLGVGCPGGGGKGAYEKPFAPSPRRFGSKTKARGLSSFLEKMLSFLILFRKIPI
jgi:hypothetical protein